jgi:hypothetical protein
LFEQRGLPRLGPYSVEALEHQGPTREAWSGREKQKEGQQYRYIDCYCAEGVMGDGAGLCGRQPRPCVVFVPGLLEPESKAASQDICLSDQTIGHANGRSLSPTELFRIFSFLRIKIKVGFHTATKHVQFRVAIGPERSYQAAAPFGVGLNEGTSPARTT